MPFVDQFVPQLYQPFVPVEFVITGVPKKSILVALPLVIHEILPHRKLSTVVAGTSCCEDHNWFDTVPAVKV